MTVPATFEAFLADVRRNDPPPFEDAAWLLWSLARSAAGTPHSLLHRATIPFTLETLAARGHLQRRRPPPAAVLATLFPGRRDYLDLIGLPLRALHRRGISTSVALPPASPVVPADLAPVPTFGLWDLASPGAYARARRAYGALVGSARAFGRRLGLTGEQRRELHLTLQGYCWQRELFAAALEATGAEVVFGLHFMLDPGIRGALREARDRGRAPSAILVQHGVFSHTWETHDFHGADCVLLWGPASVEELDAFPGPKPAATVVGFPKTLEAEEASSTGPAARRGHVLVLGTNDDEAREARALELVARALPDSEERPVVFRPHPKESKDVYLDLARRGLLAPSQVQSVGALAGALRGAAVVIGTQSTSLPEAVLLGVPAIQVLPGALGLGWEERGLASAADGHALRRLVTALFDDPTQRARMLERELPFARDLLGDPHRACDRIADALQAAVSGRRAEAPARARSPKVDEAGVPSPARDDAASGATKGRPERPLVTIMIPTYEGAQFLPTAIESALAQDYEPLEVVVLDDASPDDTALVAARYAHDPRVRVVRHERNLGRVATYRDGLYTHARGDFVLNLDGDDWLCDPTYVSAAIELVERHPEVALVFARKDVYSDRTGRVPDGEKHRGLPEVCDGTALFRRFAAGHSIPHATALYRRDLATEVGFYQHDVVGSDSLSLLLLVANRQVGFLDRPAAVWRDHGTNSSLGVSAPRLMANLAVADIPARAAAANGALPPAEARRWRRKVAARIAHQGIADDLATGRVGNAAEIVLRLTITRPGTSALTLVGLGRGAARTLRRRLAGERLGTRPDPAEADA